MTVSGVVGPGSMSHPKMGLSGKLTLVHVIIFTSVLSILFLLDILTTQAILRMGGVELNPLMAGVVTTPLMHVTLKCGVLIMIIPVALTAEDRVRGSGIVLYVTLIAMYVVVIINNATVLLPHITRAIAG